MWYVIKEKKLGLDPVFGLSATRDTRAMDSARNRNICQNKRLQTSLKTLDEDMNTKIVRCLNRLGREKHFLQTISPSPERKIVLPQGFNAEEKQTVRSLRRGSLPSISLSEFDMKLSSDRNNRSASRAQREPHRKSKSTSDAELSEFQIRRKLYRGKSKAIEEMNNKNTVPITLAVDSGIATCYPLYRQKTLAGDAYQRITSADVTRGGGSRQYKRSQSDPDIGSANKQRKNSQENSASIHSITPRRHNQTGRTDNLPDITVSLDQGPTCAGIFTTDSGEVQFSKLLRSLQTQTKLTQV